MTKQEEQQIIFLRDDAIYKTRQAQEANRLLQEAMRAVGIDEVELRIVPAEKKANNEPVKKEDSETPKQNT